MKTTNFKRSGRVLCAHRHLHPSPDSAHACDVAWRIYHRKQLSVALNVAPLVEELRAVVARATQRNLARGAK